MTLNLDIFGLTGTKIRNNTSKCLVGLLPHKPEVNGFSILSSSNSETVLSIFRETDRSWTSQNEAVSWIRIRCPYAIRIWSVGLHGADVNADTVYNITISGTNDDRAFKLISTQTCRLMDEFVMLNVENDNVRSYRIISIEFRSDAQRVSLKKMQLFIYNE